MKRGLVLLILAAATAWLFFEFLQSQPEPEIRYKEASAASYREAYRCLSPELQGFAFKDFALVGARGYGRGVMAYHHPDGSRLTIARDGGGSKITFSSPRLPTEQEIAMLEQCTRLPGN